MLCPKCSQEYEATDNFCGKCGFNLAKASPSTPPEPLRSPVAGSGLTVRPVTRKPSMSRVFYLWSIGGGYAGLIILYIVGYALIIAGAYQYEDSYTIIGSLLMLPALLLSLYVAAVSMILVYKMWEAIQDGYARTTPGKAVGFLFIPFYNFYWLFQVYWGFAQDFNKLIRRRDLNITPLSEGLFLAYSILLLGTMIPVIGFVASVAGIIIFLIIVAAVCNAVNALHEASPGRTGVQIISGNEFAETGKGVERKC